MSDDEVTTTVPSSEGQMSRRRLLQGGAALAAAGVAAPLLGGAASASTRSFGAYSTRRSVKKTKITLMSWELFEPPEIKAWEHVVDTFQKANPSIEVTWTGWPFANYDANVIAQQEAGNIQADVVMCPPELGSTLIQLYDACVPLGDLPSSLGLIPNAAHEQFTLNGKLYLVGVLEVAFLLTYDKKLLAAGGFDGPPTTTEGWLEMTKKLTHGNQYGTYLVNTSDAAADAWNTTQNFPLGFGGVWADGRTLTINSKENIAAMQYWVDLVKASGLAGTSETAMTKLWYNQQIATNLDVGFGSASLKSIAPGLFSTLASAPPPWPGKKAIARLHGNVVLKSSNYLDASLELTKWMIDPKNLWYTIQQNGYPLAPYSNFGSIIPGYDKFEASLPWAGGFAGTNYVGEANILGDYVFAFAQIGNLIGSNIVKAVSGSTSVAEALGAAQQQAAESIHLPPAPPK